MPAKRVLHYGLQRSGTNYLKKLLETRFKIEFMDQERGRDHPTHKHFRLYDDKSLIGRPNYSNQLVFKNFKSFESSLGLESPADIIFVLSKDPYSWVTSYGRWGKKNRWPDPPHPFILEYNEFYKKWYQFSEESQKIILIRYTDLLLRTEEVMNSLKTELGLTYHSEKDSTTRQIKKVPRSSRFSSKKINYYEDEIYLKEFHPVALAELNQLIDHELIKKLGYKSYF